MGKPKICFVSMNMYHLLTRQQGARGMGGGELQVLLIARELVARGYPVSFITLAYDPGEIQEDLPFHLIPSYSKQDGWPVLRFFYPRMYRLWKALQQSVDADIYYMNMASYILAPLVYFARKHGKKVLFAGAIDTDFEPEHLPVPTWKDRRMYCWGLRRCDAYVVQHRQQQQALMQNFRREGRIIYYGLPPAPDPQEERAHILWVASIKRKKHPELFVELARRHPAEKFVLVGGVPPKGDDDQHRLFEKVQAAARQVPNLTLKGFLPFEEAAREFARAKLFINTSDLEGFPTTYLQAWQRGVPVISFVNPDDLINPNRLGKVVKNLEEMSAALRDFSDGKLQFSNAHIEQFFQAHFTIQAAVDQYEKVFRSVLEINS